jgi:putative acyl-CoA dehydrogenase
MATHEVLNQPPPLGAYDVFTADAALVEVTTRGDAGWARDELVRLGRRAGGEEAIEWGRLANANPPVLRTHDRYGHRIDEVEFHPAYHELMRVALGHGLHASPWAAPRPGAHVARAAGFFVWSQVEAGHGCPVSMTYSAVPALRALPALASAWEPHLLSTDYDGRARPVAEKTGATCGMAMTEKQGGSDVRANTTRAVPESSGTGPGRPYLLTGHKWFCSAPMCDAFLVLAQAGRGLSCFFVPRWKPDGTRNHLQLQRLKDMVGEDGRGVATIIEMVNHTRLDCVIGAAAGMRQAVAQASHHTSHRRAFGKLLIDQPLMLNVLADLALESEAATVAMGRLAAAYDAAAAGDEREAAFKRLATAVVKYWVCKRQPPHAAEALECLGGNGYVEDSIMPRLFRESPLNGIWEGSGNVICLDVLRAIAREPASLEAFLDEVGLAGGVDHRLDAARKQLEAELADLDAIENRARRVVETMAIVLQASLLVRHAPAFVADAFCTARLAGDAGRAFGTLPPGTDQRAIVERARPVVG